MVAADVVKEWIGVGVHDDPHVRIGLREQGVGHVVAAAALVDEAVAFLVDEDSRNLGIRSVAVYSKEDAKSLHVQLADQRICIGEGPARNSYLNMDRIIAAAENMGADAIHPGFGFLSENSEFVRKCKENGITFIGPDADVIDKMGNKSHARKTMMDAGVPVVPGTKEPVYDAETGKKLAEEIGYPVMIKASSGGGGKGMLHIAVRRVGMLLQPAVRFRRHRQARHHQHIRRADGDNECQRRDRLEQTHPALPLRNVSFC